MLSVWLNHRFAGFALEARFDAPAGVTVLFGKSGAGKSTVAAAVAGLLRPDAGRIAVGKTVLVDTQTGTFLPPHRRRIGYVFQDGRLFPHLTVRQNLLYGRWFAPRGAGPEMGRILEMLGIGALLDRRPATLSGGEKSRVSIGRAILSNPRLLLMDEPLAALDEARKAEIMPYLERMRDELCIPVIYISHSLAEVARLATTVVLLDQGRVTACGPAAEVLADPATAPLLGLRNAGAILQARLVAHEADGLSRLECSAGPLLLPRLAQPMGASLRLRILAQDVMIATRRPEHISALNVLPCTVTDIRLGEGPGAIVQLRAGEDMLIARITRRSVAELGLVSGAQVFAVLKAVSVAQENVGAG